MYNLIKDDNINNWDRIPINTRYNKLWYNDSEKYCEGKMKRTINNIGWNRIWNLFLNRNYNI